MRCRLGGLIHCYGARCGSLASSLAWQNAVGAAGASIMESCAPKDWGVGVSVGQLVCVCLLIR